MWCGIQFHGYTIKCSCLFEEGKWNKLFTFLVACMCVCLAFIWPSYWICHLKLCSSWLCVCVFVFFFSFSLIIFSFLFVHNCVALDFSSGISRKLLFRNKVRVSLVEPVEGQERRREIEWEEGNVGGRAIESGCSVSMEFNSRMKIRLEVFAAWWQPIDRDGDFAVDSLCVWPIEKPFRESFAQLKLETQSNEVQTHSVSVCAFFFLYSIWVCEMWPCEAYTFYRLLSLSLCLPLSVSVALKITEKVNVNAPIKARQSPTAYTNTEMRESACARA